MEVLLDNLRQDPELDFVCALDRLVNDQSEDMAPQRNTGVFPDHLTDHVHQICTTFLVDSASHPIHIEGQLTKVVAFSASISPIPIYIFDELLQFVLEKLLDSVFIQFAQAELKIVIPSLEYKEPTTYSYHNPYHSYQEPSYDAESLFEATDSHSISPSEKELRDYDSSYLEHADIVQSKVQEATPTSPEPSQRNRNFQSQLDLDVYKEAGIFYRKRSMSVASTEIDESDTSSIPSLPPHFHGRRCTSVSADTAFEDGPAIPSDRRSAKLSYASCASNYLKSPIEESKEYQVSETLDRLLAKVKPVLMSPTRIKAPLLPQVNLGPDLAEDLSSNFKVTFNENSPNDRDSVDDDYYSDIGNYKSESIAKHPSIATPSGSNMHLNVHPIYNSTASHFYSSAGSALSRSPTIQIVPTPPKSPVSAPFDYSIAGQRDTSFDLEYFYSPDTFHLSQKPHPSQMPNPKKSKKLLQKLKIPAFPALFRHSTSAGTAKS